MKKVKVGKIVGTHALKGELKIRSNSDFANERFKKGNTLFLNYQGEELELEIASVRFHKNNYLVAFKEHLNINLVEKYVGLYVYGLKDQDLLEEDEFFYDDLIGLLAICKEKEIGHVTSIYNNGRHDILNIDYNGKNVAIPYVDAFIKDVDLENGTIEVSLIKGLIDED